MNELPFAFSVSLFFSRVSVRFHVSFCLSPPLPLLIAAIPLRALAHARSLALPYTVFVVCDH